MNSLAESAEPQLNEQEALTPEQSAILTPFGKLLVSRNDAPTALSLLGGEPNLGLPGGDGYVLVSSAAGVRSWVGKEPLSGDVSGPSSAVNNRVVFFDGTTGKLIKDSGLSLSGNNTGDQDLSALVPKTTKVNGHALSGDVSVTAADVGIVIGTNVEAWSSNLDGWSAKTPFSGLLSITSAKTFTVTNTLTLSGTEGSTLNVGAGGTLGSAAFTASSAYESAITSGTTAQYWRGDKSFQTLNASAVGLGSVTNDAQTKASIVPNTAPSAGQLLAGNAGGTAYAPVSLSGSGATFSLSSAGVLTISAIASSGLTGNIPGSWLGSTSTTAAAGNDSRLSDARSANAITTATSISISTGADPTDGQVLVYSTSTGKWGPGTVSGGGGGNVTGSSLTNGNVIKGSGASGIADGGFALTDIARLSQSQSFTADQTISGAALILSGNQSAAAWTTSGIRLKGISGTLTDTSSSGTVAAAYTNKLGGNTIAASSATTFTNYISSYFSEPTAGTNVTLTNKWGLGADSLYVGTSNPVKITSAGVLSATSPVLTTPDLGTPSAIALTNATSFPTLNQNTSGSAASLSATLAVASGGTNITSYAVGDLLYASGSTTLLKLADVAAGSYLRSGGVTTAPVWSTTTLPNSATTGDLLYASASNVYSNLADVATGSVLISGGTSTAPSWSSTPTFTVTNLTGTASININGTVGATTPTTGAFTTLSNTGAATNSKSGTASTPALTLSGVPFAGTGTTSFPLLYINDANATASTTMSTSGTSLGVNAHTGIGNLMELMLDGASKFKVTSTGAIVAPQITVNGGTGGGLLLTNGTRIVDQSNGVLSLLNNANTGFTRLELGGATNSASAIGFDAVNGFTLQSAAGTSTWNDSSTPNSGTVANRYLFGIAAPTLTSTGTSVTNTVASTVYIGGAPTDSTNTTSTTKWALNVQDKILGKITDAGTTTVVNPLTLGHGSSGTPAAGLGAGILFSVDSSTTVDQNAGQIAVAWSTATHASRTSYFDVLLVNSAAALTSVGRFFASGGFSVNSTTDPGAGIINANTGFRIANAATSGNVLRGNGTNFVSAQLAVGDLSGGPTGTIVGTSDTQTLTNKRITKRTGTTTSSATPTINTDNVDFYSITALAVAITSFTTNLSGTPTEAQTLWIAITDNGTARAITWGTSFEASGNVALPTTTVISTRLDVGFVWNTVTSKWRCIATA